MSSPSSPGMQNKLSLAERRRQRQQQGAEGAEGPKVTAPLSELVGNPANPRVSLPKVQELADSIGESGIAQSLTVVPVATFRDAFPEHVEAVAEASYVVINGNRRLAAAELRGLAEVPILLNTTAKTRTDILVLAMAENIQREDLAPLEELETIEQLKALLGTYDAVAKALGKSGGWVSQRRRLGNLTDEAADALRSGEVTIEEARELGKIKDTEAQQIALSEVRRNRADKAEAKKAEAGKPKPKKEAPKPRQQAPVVPHQAESSDEESKATEARRAACRDALTGDAANDTAVILAALQVDTDADAARVLAGMWLTQVNGTADEGAFAAACSAAPRQASLALALARCEMAYQAGAPIGAYVDWLVAHAAYEATESDQSTLASPPFTA